jgi:hypothetical protein
MSVAAEGRGNEDWEAGRAITDGAGAYSFPTKSLNTPQATRVLKHNDSIRSQDDDPEMAMAIDLSTLAARRGGGGGAVGHALTAEAAKNTIMAQYEFKALEFAHPTRMVRCSPDERSARHSESCDRNPHD